MPELATPARFVGRPSSLPRCQAPACSTSRAAPLPLVERMAGKAHIVRRLRQGSDAILGGLGVSLLLTCRPA